MKSFFIRNKEKISEIILAIIPLTIVLINMILGLIFNNNVDENMSIFPFLSILIIYSFSLLFSFIIKSYKKTNYILLIISFILCIINQIKLYYMEEPIYLSDIKLLSGIKDVLSLTNGTTSNLLKSNYIYFIVLFLTYSIVFLINKVLIAKEVIRKYYMLIPIVILIIASLPLKFIDKVDKYLIRSYYGFGDYQSYTSYASVYKMYGLSGGMFLNMLDSRIYKPNNYDFDKINYVLNYKSDNEEKKELDYNIILLFSESFFDMSKINELNIDENIYKNYHDLAKKGKIVQMITPSYGGRSGNVEYELFTSFNLAYYNNTYIPYLYLNEPLPETMNIINIMHNNGLKSYLAKSYSDSLYNEKNAYINLGFQNKISYNEENNKKGYYISDKYVIDQIINCLKNKNKEKIFMFYSTMQNHMPYVIDKYQEYDIDYQNDNLNKADQEAIISYLQGAYDASLELKRLYDYINSMNDKTVIIFLGDHLPYFINSNGENLINKLDYFNTDNKTLNNYRKYNTEALILSNFDIEYDDTKYLSPDLLLPYLFKFTNVGMNSYFEYLINESIKILPSYNRYVAMDNVGNLYDINKLSDDMQEEYNLRESIQYKLYFE